MFQFRRFPAYAYLIQRTLPRVCRGGFPHSEISGSMRICRSPKLIAACHVLLRLLMPRHSPCALISLTFCKSPNLVLLHLVLRIMQALEIEIKIVVCYPNKLKFHIENLISSLLLALSSIHCSVFKVQVSGFFSETRSQSSSAFQRSKTEIRLLKNKWWAQVDSNHRPRAYQARALTA